MNNPVQKKKVLLVDDEENILNVLDRYLTEKGFEVKTAQNGEKALAVFNGTKPDIVLLDIMMPGLNGIETLKMMKKIDHACKVIIVSAIKDEKIYRECCTIGIVDYIGKPFNLTTLDIRVLGKLI